MGKSSDTKADVPSVRLRSVRGLLDLISRDEAEDALGQTVTLPDIFDTTRNLSIIWTEQDWTELYARLDRLKGTKQPKKRGRPRSASPNLNIDAIRAWAIWWCVRQWREAGVCGIEKMTVAQLIDGARDLPRGEKYFRRANITPQRLASSVSVGKKMLGIDADWFSETCEKKLPFNRNR
jgi:hypothetical protein